jgi:hypothetical protein
MMIMMAKERPKKAVIVMKKDKKNLLGKQDMKKSKGPRRKEHDREDEFWVPRSY